MDRQTLRDWVTRFNGGGVDGVRDQPRSGRPARMTEGQQATLKAVVLRGPDPERDGASTWCERGLHPTGAIDHRYASAWLYAAVRPGADEAFALVMPEVSAAAMQISPKSCQRACVPPYCSTAPDGTSLQRSPSRPISASSSCHPTRRN